MTRYFLMIKKDGAESWKDAVKKHANANQWTMVGFGSTQVEYLNQRIYPQEREEISEWAATADKENPSWLGNVYFIPHVAPQSAADYAWSAIKSYSSDVQNPILSEFREKLVDTARREAEIEKMRSNSQYMANTLNKRNSSSLSKIEIMLRKIEVLDEFQLEELLVSKDYQQSPESVKTKIAERYLELQKIDRDAEWRGIEEAGRYS